MHSFGTRRPGAASAVALALLVAALAGCQGGGTTSAPSSSERSEPAGSRAHVLAVKIDNVGPARPQTGLDKADIVYVEQVEAGLSRMLAAYSSRLPGVVGPVRSARETDLELLRQFDRPTLAFSGAQSKLLPAIAAAPLEPLTPETDPDAYFRGSDRAAPHNLYLRPARASHTTTGVNAAEDIGLRFAAAVPGGKPVAGRTVRYPAARFSFTWSAERSRWLVSMDGTPARTADGARLGAADVVVQYVTVRPSLYQDRWGSKSPYTETVGSGSAVVLRGGKEYDVEWSRPAADAATSFTTRDGERMTFAPGQVWIVFASE
ncbi:DUF3048 domain-containing protein [Streptomyces sp. NBC_00825]|uniref:DUF3048 domain-containing protein n=1 Tax=unclassified Streptomyces TaxID=2593676 RepID=UPI00225522F5|nr:MULTISPECIES: DUF3048 domain-containing protein [unclassified Streptomyces]WTB52593.1 DUF3048 domain-containing protein [Streptomyces sp. NBC_00826]WTH94515.1 DUF3048 domain-containing protein [Streptomyces sp. NBC_00825]WTI03250.1 DUF3048 domain-containing protein [Streptomyces sp. NBC_00822]MCX4868798.1 DUF3048 domain-containing protein [Streptomyces sp. NBC_00906]MCX4900036.1 DUF3048 domain-containing protein [Streptomyces sp. NBC_00892]